MKFGERRLRLVGDLPGNPTGGRILSDPSRTIGPVVRAKGHDIAWTGRIDSYEPRILTVGPRRKIAVLGDIHSRWNRVQTILDHEFPEGNGVALATGDLVNYPQIENGHRIFFVHGNHENHGLLSQLRKEAGQLVPMFAGDILKVGAVLVAGLPGVFSPHFFDDPLMQRLKYFTREDLQSTNALQGGIDILLMHDGPSSIGLVKDGTDIGSPLLRGLIEFLRPTAAFFGHHHQNRRGTIGTAEVFGLDYPHRSYMVIEEGGGDVRGIYLRRANITGREFKFGWQTGAKDDSHSLLSWRVIMTQAKFLNLLGHLKEGIVASLTKLISERKTLDIETARARSNLAFNQVKAEAASYAHQLEKDPHMAQGKKEELLRQVYDNITKGVSTADAMDDITTAFSECLKTLGLLGK